MRATTEELEDFHVKLRVEVDDVEAQPTLDKVIKAMAKEARLPGFRPGKVPVKVLEARMGGSGALRNEAIREALSEFYLQAVTEAGVDPIAQGQIDVPDEELDGAIVFEATVKVRPRVELEGYQGLEVTIPSPLVSDAEIEAQIDRIRQADGELNVVERPCTAGDFVVIDITSQVGDNEPAPLVEEYSYRVGANNVMPDLDDHLEAMVAGETKSFTQSPEGTDIEVNWTVTVREVKEQVLPELTDAWVEENTEFATVGELRDSLLNRLKPIKVVQSQFAFNDVVRSSLANLVGDEFVLEELLQPEIGERVQNFQQRLNQQQMSLQQYLQMAQQTQEQLVAGLQAEAAIGVKLDLALRAVARAEGLAPTEEDLATELENSASGAGVSAAVLEAQIRSVGRWQEFIGEVTKVKAMNWVIDQVNVVDEQGVPVDREVLRTNQAEQHDHDHDHGHDHDHDHSEDEAN